MEENNVSRKLKVRDNMTGWIKNRSSKIREFMYCKLC